MEAVDRQLSHRSSDLPPDLVTAPRGEFVLWVGSTPTICMMMLPVTLNAGPLESKRTTQYRAYNPNVKRCRLGTKGFVG